MTLDEPMLSDAQIATVVRSFYTRARTDSMVGPDYDHMVDDWEARFRLVQRFWSCALCNGSQESCGTANNDLPFDASQFDRWCNLFCQATLDVLRGDAARRTVKQAERIALFYRNASFPVPEAAVTH
ncbi:globin family protein [Derxia lacustris]|uniref:group III truncated hemoglobin n=1 Tax=Derxia lacustris TaxID=764842 RepID=UPI000A178567|nr:group III truncated hemoglobin [Derxia lacustris]